NSRRIGAANVFVTDVRGAACSDVPQTCAAIESSNEATASGAEKNGASNVTTRCPRRSRRGVTSLQLQEAKTSHAQARRWPSASLEIVHRCPTGSARQPFEQLDELGLPRRLGLAHDPAKMGAGGLVAHM